MSKIEPYIDNDIENTEFHMIWTRFNGLGITNPPYRMSLYSPFDRDKFYEILDQYVDEESEEPFKTIMETSEHVNESGVSIKSSRYLVQLVESGVPSWNDFWFSSNKIKASNGALTQEEISKINDINLSPLYIGFLDEKSPMGETVMNITIYYSLDNKDIMEEIKESLESIKIDTVIENSGDDSEEEDKVFKIKLDEVSFFTEVPIDIKLNKWKTISEIYSKKVKKKSKKLYKNINEKPKGLHVLSGDRGSGKTNLIKTIIPKLEKRVIYLPLTLFDSAILSPNFIDYLKSNQNSVLVIDDCESYFNKIHQKSNLYVNNVLQILESIEELDLHIILSLNIDVNSVDENLLLSKSCLTNVNLDKIKGDKLKKLSKIMGFEGNIKKSSRVYP
jgi:hypothetical protein